MIVALTVLIGTVMACGSDADAPSNTGEVAETGKIVKILNKDPAMSTKYGFDPKDLTFDVGETITFRLTAQAELHNFTIDELNIDMDIEPRETEDLEMTFNEAGEYRFYCLFHEENGMEGTITVK